MPFLTVPINTPENCFVQFRAAHVHVTEGDDCIILLQECLPAYNTGDINFQLFLDAESAPGDSVYYLRLISDCADDSVIDIFGDGSKYATIEWEMNEAGDQAVGFLSLENSNYVFKNSAAMDAGDCFKIGIFSNATKYQYGSFAGTVYGTMTIEIIVDGSPQTVTAGVLSLQGIADALTLLLTDDEWIVSGNNIYTNATSGAVYGTITIDDGRLTPYEPTITADNEKLISCSTCFTVVNDRCFTSVVKYRNNESAFGFDYETVIAYAPTFYNMIRLPLWLHNLQPFSEENAFTLSDGSKKLLSARLGVQKQGEVNYLSDEGHILLAIALKHDGVQMKVNDETSFTSYVVDSVPEITDIDTPGTNVDARPAKFKCTQTPFYGVNSNCQ